MDIVRDALRSRIKIGIQLLFVPEEYGGFGGGAFDVYCICEEMARMDLGVATRCPRHFPRQRSHHSGRLLRAKGALVCRGSRMRGFCSPMGRPSPMRAVICRRSETTADRVMEDGKVVGYRINGSKQWISNGGIADAYTILANAPGGPTWFIVDKGAEGFAHDEPEDKHGIRLSNTAALSLNNVYVDFEPPGRRRGRPGIAAGAGCHSGYTRLMVAAFGLGSGWNALDHAIPYSTKRIQGGAPLSEKQGYTHKLIVPNVARLEAGRAYLRRPRSASTPVKEL